MCIQSFFLSVKGGIILSNNNGFTLLEVLIAMSIIFMLMTTIIPITSLLERERTVLSERRMFSSKLHDELQPFLWNDLQLPSSHSDVINLINVTFSFTYEGQYIKGCVNWENARKKSETICLYGLR